MRYGAAILFMLAFLSCEGGLAPERIKPGFGGTITFLHETWPSRDSLVNLWIVASLDYPLDSAKVIEGILFSDPPRIHVFPDLTGSLPLYVDSVSYAFFIPPAEYKYIAVVQRFKNEISVGAIRVVGLYGTGSPPREPLSLKVRDAEFIDNINIRVDFHHPPPPPF